MDDPREQKAIPAGIEAHEKHENNMKNNEKTEEKGSKKHMKKKRFFRGAGFEQKHSYLRGEIYTARHEKTSKNMKKRTPNHLKNIKFTIKT